MWGGGRGQSCANGLDNTISWVTSSPAPPYPAKPSPALSFDKSQGTCQTGPGKILLLPRQTKKKLVTGWVCFRERLVTVSLLVRVTNARQEGKRGRTRPYRLLQNT